MKPDCIPVVRASDSAATGRAQIVREFATSPCFSHLICTRLDDDVLFLKARRLDRDRAQAMLRCMPLCAGRYGER